MVTRQIEGVILGSYHSGESDQTAILLSPKEGRIKMLARGIRKINSRRLGSLETGNLVKVILRHSQSIDTLNEIEVIDHFHTPKTGLTQINTIFLLCELANRLLLEGEGGGDIYQLFFKTRTAIKNNQIKQVLFFENQLLDLIGFGRDEKVEQLIAQSRWQAAQKQLRTKIEGVIERHLTSPKLFS